MVERRDAHRVLVWKPKEKRLFENTSLDVCVCLCVCVCVCVCKIKIDFQEI